MSTSHVDDVLPLSPLQEGLLFHTLLAERGTEIYNVQLVLELRHRVEPSILRAAVTELLHRHPNLRGGFRYSKANQPVQVVPRTVKLPWSEIDLSDREPQARDAELGRLKDEDRVRRFTPARPPLLRCTLVRLAAERFQLVVTYHHMLFDGWSVPLVVRDLLALYAAHADASGLPPAAPYRDYLKWLARTDRDAAERAWREALAGLEEPTLMASPDPLRVPELPATFSVELSEETTDRLVTAGREAGLTLNTVVQGAWAVLLGRHTGRDDIVFGSIVSGRPPEVARIEDMVGLFINALPVRMRLRPDEKLSDSLRRTQNEQGRLAEHQHLPLGELHRLSGLRELFDTLVVFESYPVDRSALEAQADRSGATVLEVTDSTHYPLTLTVIPGERLRLVISCRSDLFPEPTALALRRQLGDVLEEFATGLQRPAAAYDPLPRAERHRLLHSWNDTAHPVPDTGLVERFEDQVARTPDAEAVVFEGRRLSYAEFDARVNRLAHLLREQGAGPGRIVALALPRSAELVVAVWAVLKSGAAYLPLDPDHPAERLAQILAEADPVALVTRSGGDARFGGDVPRVAVETAERTLRPDGTPWDGAPSRGVLPAHPAYLIYTSGSTGTPKGVLVSHQGITNRLRWMQDTYRLRADDRVLQKTPAGFDVSVWEFLWPLTEGATLVVARPDGHRDPRYLAELMRTERVTTAHFVPSMLRVFLDEPSAAGCTTLRRVICSGEALTADLVNRFAAVLDVPLHNLYGPTEASIDVTSWTCAPGPEDQVVPIGHPVWNTRAHVLDAALRPTPVGVTGELYLAGVQLARGYLNRPDHTAERFVADPFGLPGSRMYRTGDLARRRQDGALEFAGRADDQVKIRGVRVEPGEIGAVLAAHPAVAGAAVVVREDRPGHQRLVAYVVLAGEGEPDSAELRAHASAHLPHAMVPAVFVPVEALPLTPNGKLDRRALPPPPAPEAVRGRAPRSPQEEILTELFAEVLGLPVVGVDDDFFELGGHSLLAARLAGRIREVLGRAAVQDLFRAPTVARLAERLGVESPAPDGDTLLPLRASGKRPPLFCMPPAGGLSWCYAGLLRHIDAEHPVYGLQVSPSSGTDPLPASMARLAEDFVAEIRSVRPSGPYHLLGWSFGGVLAHAVATTLEAQGEEVALLAVLDAYPRIEGAADHLPDAAAVYNGLLAQLGHDQAEPGSRPMDVDLAKDLLRETGSALSHLERNRLSGMVDVFRNNFRLQHAGHTPGVFSGDLLFFSAALDKVPGGPDARDWQPHVRGRVTEHPIACTHGSMTQRDPLAEIGRTVSRTLRHLHTRHRGADRKK
ncbi:amino acid adenylation domain-containing protein [Streptomyces sp. NPDC002476]|uniref:amino acid adenylation domain-containing protein n=1 Tax=Streptomyces sp. NPDC002476 TaxID=3364648 RepID=UPI0036A7C005